LNKILLALLFSFTAHASLNEVDKAEVLHENNMFNPGFENGLQGWTASGGTTAVIDTGTNLLKGKRSITWDAGAAAQTLCSKAVTIEEGDKGENGLAWIKIKTPSGTATHTIYAYDGTNPVGQEVTVGSDATGVFTRANFIYPSSGTMQFCIEAQADEPLVAIDLGYMGHAANITEVKDPDVFSAKVVFSGGVGTVSQESSDWIDGNCVHNGSGTVTCTLVDGIFSVEPNVSCFMTNVSGSNSDVCESQGNTATSIAIKNEFVGAATFGNRTANTFWLMAQKQGVDAPTFTAVKADDTAGSRVRLHTHNGYGSTNTVIGRFTTIVEDVGSAIVYADSATDGASFTIQKDGIYAITAIHGSRGVAGVGQSGISLNSTQLTTGISAINVADRLAYDGHSSTVAHSTGALAKNASWTGWLNKGDVIRPHHSTTIPDVAAMSSFTIAHVTSSMNSPLIKNSVVSSSNGVEDIERVAFGGASENTNCTGTCTIYRSTPGISSVSRTGTGAYTINFVAGTFTGPPNCTGVSRTVGVGASIVTKNGTPTATTFPVLTRNNSDAAANSEVVVNCQGPK
jgi:hypothetical protein